MRYYLTPSRLAIIKRPQVTNPLRKRRKRNPLQCWWECKLVQPLWKSEWRFLKNTKSNYQMTQQFPSWIYIIFEKLPMFTAELLAIAKIRSNQRTHQQINAQFIDIYTHTLENYSVNKKMTILLFVTCTGLEGITLSEIRQKYKYQMLSLLCES